MFQCLKLILYQFWLDGLVSSGYLVCVVEISIICPKDGFDFFFCVLDSSCPEVQMGFCMETTGMTQGGQSEAPSDLEMERGSVEETDLKGETESMEDDQDPEVGTFTPSVFTKIQYVMSLTFVKCSSFNWLLFLLFFLLKIVWANDSGDKITEIEDWLSCKWHCIQGSRFEGYLECWSSAAGSGTPGCQQEEEKTTEKSWFVYIYHLMLYINFV